MLEEAEKKPVEEDKQKVTYYVTVEGATYEQYRKILDICPLAEAVKEHAWVY